MRTVHRLRSYLRGLERSCFEAEDARRLASVRMLTGLFALIYVGMRADFLSHLGEGPSSTFQPIGIARVLSAPLGIASLKATVLLTLVGLALFSAGVLHRVLAPITAALLWWLLTYRNSWVMVYHTENLLLLHIVVLALTPAANAWAADDWLRHKPGLRLLTWPRRAEREHASYGWPLVLLNAVTAATYFLAGVAKIAGPLGLRWGSGRSLYSQLTTNALRYELFGERSHPIRWLARHPWVLTPAAVGTLLIELGAPLFVLPRGLGLLWAFGALGFHWGIFAIMGIKFRYNLCGAAYLSFFARVRRRPTPTRGLDKSPAVAGDAA